MLKFNNDNNIEYAHSGLFTTETDWIHPKRIEVTYEIICVKKGTIHLEENGISYTMNKGDLIILKPGISHKGFCISTGETSFYWVHFYAKDLEELGINSNYIHHFSNIVMFQQLLHISNTKEYPFYSTDALLLMILGEIACFFIQSNMGDSQPVRDAYEWIREPVEKVLSLNKTVIMS